MIYTSYFGAMRKMSPEQKERCVSIARFTPKGIKIKAYPQLAPRKEFLQEYKEYGDKSHFADQYLEQLEDTVDAYAVEKELDGKILCCFEKPGDFCHRHVLKYWLACYEIESEELTV